MVIIIITQWVFHPVQQSHAILYFSNSDPQGAQWDTSNRQPAVNKLIKWVGVYRLTGSAPNSWLSSLVANKSFMWRGQLDTG